MAQESKWVIRQVKSGFQSDPMSLEAATKWMRDTAWVRELDGCEALEIVREPKPGKWVVEMKESGFQSDPMTHEAAKAWITEHHAWVREAGSEHDVILVRIS